MNFQVIRNESRRELRAMQSLETWQHFHLCVLAHINHDLTRADHAVKRTYNTLKYTNQAALDAHTMLILPRSKWQGEAFNWM